MAAPETPRGTPRDTEVLVGRGCPGCDTRNPRGEAKLLPCSELWGGRLPGSVSPGPGGTAETRGVAAGCISARSWSKASWCLRGLLGLGGACRPLHPQHPFVSPREVLVTVLRPLPTPQGNLQPHLPPQTQTISSCRAKRHHWDGGSGTVRLLGGTRVGDVPTVPDSPCPTHCITPHLL